MYNIVKLSPIQGMENNMNHILPLTMPANLLDCKCKGIQSRKEQIFIDQSAKKFKMKLLIEVRIDSTAIYIMKTIVCESWFSVREEILPN